MNCNTLLSQNLSATKIAQAANMYFYSHFIILSFYSTPELQQVLSRQHSFSSVMNSFPSGIGYGQMNFTRAVPRKVWGSPGWRCARKQRQMSARSWLAQNRALGHRGQRLMEGSSSAAEKPNLLGVSTIFHQHQINHHYTSIPSHSNVAAETARNIISVLEAHRAQDLSGQIINQMNFNRSRMVLTTSEHRLV